MANKINFEINLNTIIFICGQIITLTVLILSVREKIDTMNKSIVANTKHIYAVEVKQNDMCVQIGKIQGSLER